MALIVNGTTVKKLIANDTTCKTGIANGVTVFKAVDEIVIVPNSSGYPSSAFTKFQNTGSGSGSASISAQSTYLQVNTALNNLYAGNIGYYVRVTINGQTKMDIAGTFAMTSGSSSYGSGLRVSLQTSTAYDAGIVKGVSYWLKGSTSTNCNTTIDISGLNGTYYLTFQQNGCDLMNYGGYIKLTKLRLYD